jgi:hypothetical protein
MDDNINLPMSLYRVESMLFAKPSSKDIHAQSYDECLELQILNKSCRFQAHSIGCRLTPSRMFLPNNQAPHYNVINHSPGNKFQPKNKLACLNLFFFVKFHDDMSQALLAHYTLWSAEDQPSFHMPTML